MGKLASGFATGGIAPLAMKGASAVSGMFGSGGGEGQDTGNPFSGIPYTPYQDDQSQPFNRRRIGGNTGNPYGVR